MTCRGRGWNTAYGSEDWVREDMAHPATGLRHHFVGNKVDHRVSSKAGKDSLAKCYGLNVGVLPKFLG